MTVSELRFKAPKINFTKTKWGVNTLIVLLLKEAFLSEGP